MIVVENVYSALGQLWVNKFRSVLTTLGIVIAVSAVIAVVSILQGMTDYVASFIQGLGSDAIWVQPYVPPEKSARGVVQAKLTYEDAEAIRKECPSVKEVAPLLQNQVILRYGDREETFPLLGTTTAFQTIRDWYVDEGRFFSDHELATRRDVCVLGRDCLDALDVRAAEVLGRKVRIGGRPFTVVGVLEKKGSFFGQAQDEVILVPFFTATKIYGRSAAESIVILAQASSTEAADTASSEIQKVLRREHKLRPEEKDDFKIATQDQALQFFDRASQLATFVLAGVVGISLLVGGIGIMNIMLVSVTERTREIGVLKALGARDKDVLLQFLIEAVVLSLVGGMIGIALGVGTAYAVTSFAPIPRAQVPLWSIAVGFLFSAGVGIFFGMYPAVQAARLNPIEALRYE
ncbi:MAG: ABC transporter permease [Planctomycetes bacterium]|nr:ABC transporter permease [Planctomycetota bacterium]